MSKVVFLSLPTYSHTNATLPLVKELVARGEEVIYYSTQTFEEQIKWTGAQYRKYRTEPPTSPTTRADNMAQVTCWIMYLIRSGLDLELEGIRQEKPNYVIHDLLALWGKCIAEILHLPAICLIPTFVFDARAASLVPEAGLERLPEIFSWTWNMFKAFWIKEDIRKRYGLRRLRLQDLYVSQADLNIVYTSRLFVPFSETFDDRFQFVGPFVAGRQERGEFPWQEIQHDVLVYVSLGTAFNQDKGFFHMCFEALGDLDCQVVVSTGGGFPVDSFAKTPDNFIMRNWVPQLAILQRAALCITNGGLNTVHESLYYSVPVVAIPTMFEHAVIAHQVENLGAGVYLRKRKATSQTLREAVQRVLADESYRRNSMRIGDSFREAGGPKRAVDEIVKFKERHGIGLAATGGRNVSPDRWQGSIQGE